MNITEQRVFNTTQSRKTWCFSEASIVRVLAYVAIMVLSLFGNSMTIFTIVKRRLARKNAHLFLLNMAIADLVVTVVYMPRMVVKMIYGTQWLVDGTLGLVLCRTIPFLHHVSLLVSVLSILGVTVDRFCAIMFPFRIKMTLNATRIVIITTWAIAVCLRSPYLLAPTLTVRSDSKIGCASNIQSLLGNMYEYYTKGLLCLYCTLLTITFILYILLIIKLQRTKTPGVSNKTSKARKQQASKKLLNMLLVITVCFILCWFVYFFAFAIFTRPLPCTIRFIRFFLAHCNSAINPFVLVIFNTHYREGYKVFCLSIIPGCGAGLKDGTRHFDSSRYSNDRFVDSKQLNNELDIHRICRDIEI